MPEIARLPSCCLAADRWVRRHSVHLLRVAALVLIFAVTALAGHTCHGLIGPSGYSP